MSDDLTPDDSDGFQTYEDALQAHPDTKNQELSDYRRQLVEKDAEIAQLQKRSAELELLLGECIRNKYYNETACSPSWLKKEAKAQLDVES